MCNTNGQYLDKTSVGNTGATPGLGTFNDYTYHRRGDFLVGHHRQCTPCRVDTPTYNNRGDNIVARRDSCTPTADFTEAAAAACHCPATDSAESLNSYVYLACRSIGTASPSLAVRQRARHAELGHVNDEYVTVQAGRVQGHPFPSVGTSGNSGQRPRFQRRGRRVPSDRCATR